MSQQVNKPIQPQVPIHGWHLPGLLQFLLYALVVVVQAARQVDQAVLAVEVVV
jgi:hypothetical protein